MDLKIIGPSFYPSASALTASYSYAISAVFVIIEVKRFSIISCIYL